MHSFLSVLGILCLVACGAVCGAAQNAYSGEAERIDALYYNGNIYTMTETPEEARDVRKAHKAEVVATRDGRIVYVGEKDRAEKLGYVQAARRLVDLKGKTLLPGFVDGHGHFPEQGQYDLYEINLNSYPLGPMASIEDYRKALEARCKAANPGEWVLGWGYDDTSITERRHPTRYDIDGVCPDNPVYLRHISGHMGVANSMALRRANITPANPEIFHTDGVVKDSQGQAAGLLMETRAMGLVTSLPEFPHSDPQKSLARANHVYAAAGVTTADQGASMIPIHLPLFQTGLARNNLSLRVVLHPLAVYEQTTPDGGAADAAGWMNRAALGWRESGRSASSDAADVEAFLFADAAEAVKTGGDITRRPVAVYAMAQDARTIRKEADIPAPPGLAPGMLFLGAWKLLFDGSPQGYTAWLKYPGYYDWGTYTAADSFDGASFFNGAKGTLNISPQRLEQLLRLYHRAGQSTETHVNGNAAAEAWVTAMEKTVTAFPDVEDSRHTAIHAQMLELQHIQRMTGNYAALEGSAFLYAGLTGAFQDGRLNPAEVGASDIQVLSALMKKQHLFSSYFIDHVYFWGERHRNIFMGPGRANNMSPVGWSIYYEQPYAFHSDTFVTPVHPMRSVQTAVTRTTAPTPLSKGGTLISGTGGDIHAVARFPARDPVQVHDSEEMGVFPNYDQRINALQALLGVTRLPAWQNKLETRFGSLREGLAADFVILEQDPLAVAEQDAHKLAAIRVMTTIVGDRIAFGFLPGARVLASPPVPAYIRNEGTVITLLDNAPADAPDEAKTAGREKTIGAYSINASVQGAGIPLFQMDVLGNGGLVRDMRLYRVDASGLSPFAYSVSGQTQAGSFWIAPLSEPIRMLQPEERLEMDAPYLVFFALSPDKSLAEGPARNQVAARIFLSTTGTLPENGQTTP